MQYIHKRGRASLICLILVGFFVKVGLYWFCTSLCGKMETERKDYISKPCSCRITREKDSKWCSLLSSIRHIRY